MERRIALPLIQDARGRLVQIEAICKAVYCNNATIDRIDRDAILAFVCDAMEKLRALKVGLDK
jgi:hypothetical protein